MAKKVSRAAQRERLLRAAAEVDVPECCDVVVVGGGAAGLAAAIAAAEAGASVVVLERDLECGRPILATGNGRCNFANSHLDPARYSDPAFVEATCGLTWLEDVLGFFRASGLRWCAEDDRLYPLSRQASSVRNVLLARAQRAGVVLAPARTVKSIAQRESLPSSCADADSLPSSAQAGPDAGPAARLANREDADCRHGREIMTARGFAGGRVASIVSFDGPDGERLRGIRARVVILASGGMHQQSIAGIDLPVIEGRPVLCPLACEPSPLTRLDGRRAHASAALTRAAATEPCWSERGEVLFRSYGLSGIVVFDASRRATAGDLIELDLAPELDEDELLALADPTGTGAIEPGRLDGVLDPAIASQLEGLARTHWHIDWPARTAPASDTGLLARLAKALPFIVAGPADTDHAQVMRGGFATEAFDPTTLAARTNPWLFACGEALDIDADCGGFNLAWAWKSGLVAGRAAATRAASL